MAYLATAVTEPDTSDQSRPPRSRRIEGLVQRLVDATTTWLPLALVIAVSPGVFLWGLRHRDSLAVHLLRNRLGPDARRELLVVVAASALFVAAVYGMSLWRAAALHGRWDPAAPRRLNRRLAFLVAPAFALAIIVPGFSVEHRYLVLVLAALAAAAVGRSAIAVAPKVECGLTALVRRAPWTRLVPVTAVVAMIALYAYGVIRLELMQHRAMRTGAYDLGIYTNILWQSLHGNWLGCSFIKGGTHASAHYDPILIALSPAMLVHRGAETLIIIQGVWTASAALPVYMVGARKGGRVFGLALAFAFLAQPALHGVSTFDFHSMGLSIPFVVWAVYLVERGAIVGYAVAIALLLICREDMAIAASCVGLYAITATRRVRVGVVTIVVSAVYLAVVKLFAMTDSALLMRDSAQSYEYGSYFSGLSGAGGAEGIVATFSANPVYLLTHVLQEQRVFYILVLLVPVCFLPLLAGRRWVLLGYGMIFVLLASRDAVYTVGFHYAATALPGVFALAPAGADRAAHYLERVRRIPQEHTYLGLAAASTVAALFVGAAFGAFVPNAGFKAGFYPLVHELTPSQEAEYEAFLELTRDIPPDAPLTASGFALPHLATREHLSHMPDVEGSDWVVVRTANLPAHEAAGLRVVRRDTQHWELVGERLGTAVFRRRQTASAAGQGEPTDGPHQDRVEEADHGEAQR